MWTIVSVIGTRPEAIKMAPVALRLAREAGLRSLLCLTGQHREMLHPMLESFSLTPDADLGVMQPGQTLAALSARTAERLDAYYSEVRPDLVLVQGDTTTVFAATLAAFYRKVPVGHVEAGLRTGDLSAPWPEEAHRVLTSRLATLHFAPTPRARDNLLHEGVDAQVIEVTGNPGIDALQLTRARLDSLTPGCGAGSPMVLITAHRRESLGAPLKRLCAAIADLARRFPDVSFVYPVHRNPEVLGPVHEILGGITGNVHLIEPVDYPEFVRLMADCTLILTDSGGIQEEAPSLGKPVLVLREVTERPEAVEAGTVRLVGTDPTRIVAEVTALLTDPTAYSRMARTHNPYGDGHAAGRIVSRCLRFLESGGSGRHPK